MRHNNDNTYRTSCGKQLGSRPASSTDSMHSVFSVGTKTCTQHSEHKVTLLIKVTNNAKHRTLAFLMNWHWLRYTPLKSENGMQILLLQPTVSSWHFFHSVSGHELNHDYYKNIWLLEKQSRVKTGRNTKLTKYITVYQQSNVSLCFQTTCLLITIIYQSRYS